jgi:hypothetical protein
VTRYATMGIAGRCGLFAVLSLVVALTVTVTSAQTRPRTRTAKPHKGDAGAHSEGGVGPSRTEKAAPSSGGDGGGGEVVQTKTLDGGAKVFRFGELEIEGRLKNPQLVFFLRRVRAEFAAGDLGHRSFLRELSETKQDPNF